MTTLIQRSFTGGEVTPSMQGRVDTIKYATGCKTLRNMRVMRHGGAENRAGTKFVSEVKTSSSKARLIPFVFNNSQTYVLEFGNEYMRVHKEGVLLSDLTLTITGISNANPGVVTYTGTDPSDGDEVYNSGVVGTIGTYINNRNFKIANVNTGANTFELQDMDSVDFDTTSLGSYTSGGTAERIYEIATPYAEADLFDINYVQSADVITLVHPTYGPRDLARTGDTSWTLTLKAFGPANDPPSAVMISGTTNVLLLDQHAYAVSLVDAGTGEETIVAVGGQDEIEPPSVADPHTITWTASGDAVSADNYYIYYAVPGSNLDFGFIGSVSAAFTTFEYNASVVPNYNEKPLVPGALFDSSDDYPAAITYYQQRLVLGGSNNKPETTYASQTGYFTNFGTHSPIQDDDGINFTLAGRQVNRVKHYIDVGKLLIFTSGAEWIVNGDGVSLLPTAINAGVQTYNGSGNLAPIVISGSVLYLQARGSIIRDFNFDFNTNSFRGSDLTIFSAHLFDNYTLADWTFQQIPHSNLWAVRSDGTMLGLTYIREQEISAWHRHDTDGLYESVCSVPEGNEDVLYTVVNRTINGSTRRYVERHATRLITDIEDAIFMDSTSTYDGRNSSATTMTLSGGSAWSAGETLTLTASASYFDSSDVGNQIYLDVLDSAGDVSTRVKLTITGYTSATVVTGTPDIAVPLALQAVATTAWAKAVDELSGLWHLEGKNVSVFADGATVHSPNNSAYTTKTVTNGQITLTTHASVVHVGLGYISDIQTLDLDSPQGGSIVEKFKLTGKVILQVEKSQGVWIGIKPPLNDATDPLQYLEPVKIEGENGQAANLDISVEKFEQIIATEHNFNGRVFVRQVDPAPMSILAIAPEGLYPGGGG